MERMYVIPTPKPIGPPRGRTGRYRIDMEKLLSLHALGYSLRQIARVLEVSDTTVRLRLRESLKEPPDPRFSEMGRKGQKARKKAMRRRRREAEAAAEAEEKDEAGNQEEAGIQNAILTYGFAALAADLRTLREKQGDLR